jgi:hypothetical protein
MILNFEDELGKRHFEFCFVGFVLGGSLQNQKGMQVLRTEVGLFEKLESISELKSCGKKMVNGEPERQLKAEGNGSRQIQITVHEFDLLYSYVTTTPWQSGTPAKMAVETIDWLENANRSSRG